MGISLRLIKTIASVFLVLSFVLPLSQCTSTVGKGELAAANAALYGYEMVMQGWEQIEKGKFEGLYTLLAVFSVFFVPIVFLKLKEQLQAVIYFLNSFFAGYILYIWVFLFSTRPQIGGLIAVICWVVLFSASAVTLFQIWRSKVRKSMRVK